MKEFINYNIMIKDIGYKIILNKNVHTRLNNHKEKITLGIVNKAFRNANISLFKDGVNSLIIKSSNLHDTYNSILFSFNKYDNSIFIFKIANKYIPLDKIKSFQFIDEINVNSIKTEKYLNKIENGKIRKVIKTGLRIVEKVKWNH